MIPSEDMLSALVLNIRNEFTLVESQIAAQAFVLAHDISIEAPLKAEIEELQEALEAIHNCDWYNGYKEPCDIAREALMKAEGRTK